MAVRRAAYRKRHQNRFSMFLVTLVVLMILIVVSVKSVDLRRRIDVYNTKAEQLQKQIDGENQRTQEIDEFRKYTQTKKYAEEVAKDKLGLVYDGEILFKEE